MRCGFNTLQMEKSSSLTVTTLPAWGQSYLFDWPTRAQVAMALDIAAAML